MSYHSDMRYVLDTNVVAPAPRNPSGASAELLGAALRGEFGLVLSVAMVLEYEAVCCDPQQRIESGLQEGQVRTVIDALRNTSINQFVEVAVAEKLSAMKAAEFFTERRANADPEAATSILSRHGGQPPEPRDQLPDPGPGGNSRG